MVTATRHPERPFDIPLAVTVVPREELREQSARTAAEALRRKPGIWVQKTGHLGGAPILRGFMGNRVTYLFDGIRRNTAGLFAGPNSYLQNIDALDIDRIEVVRGPGSVLYGSDAIGGVINVISNEVPRFAPEPSLGGNLYTRYGSADQEWSSRVESYYSDGDVFAHIGGTSREIGDVEGGQGVGVQSPSGWRERDLDAQLDLRIDAKSSVELFLQSFSRPRGYRYDRPNWVQSNDRDLYGARYRAEDLGGFVSELEVTGYFHDQEDFIDEKFFDSDSDEETLGFEVQATSYVGSDVRLIYGLHVHRDQIEKSNPQAGTVDPDVEWINPAAYVLSEWQATERLRLDLGLRWDSFTLDSSAPQLGQLDPVLQTAIGNGALSLNDLELNESDQAVTGGFGAVYALTDHTNLVAHVGRAFRAPNKNDLLSFGQFTFGFNVPATNLEPESSWTYELGVRTEDEDYSAAATGFYTEVDNAIVSAPGTFDGSTFVDVDGSGFEDPGEAVYVKGNSDGTVRATGVEVEARRWLPRDWSRAVVDEGEFSCYGNFAWIYGEDSGSGEPLDRAYPANGLVGLRLDETREASESRWWLEAELWLVRKFDRIPSNRKTSDPAFFVDPQDPSSGLIGGDGSLPGFGVVNLRGGRRLGKHSTLYVGVENVGDKAYRVKDSRIDAPGINFVLGISASF
ncbi:TonB-dependent receptor [Engelhardtia mirabilis]|uniref:TonB-dependent receptor plug domain-containing protein n=1 Tax=Engelhardtia mirabilis TaxID=2528011 RepID=UPI0011A8CB36